MHTNLLTQSADRKSVDAILIDEDQRRAGEGVLRRCHACHDSMRKGLRISIGMNIETTLSILRFKPVCARVARKPLPTFMGGRGIAADVTVSISASHIHLP